MEKFYEKKNLGVPSTILCVLAYGMGYFLTDMFSGILTAALFALVVFAFQFDDRVKMAVKQSYLLAFLFILVNSLLNAIGYLGELFKSAPDKVQKIFTDINSYGSSVVEIAIIVVYVLYIIFALVNKDLKLGFLLGMIGEGAPKQVKYQQQYQQPMYQQPMQQPNMQQPNMQQPVQGVICRGCGAANQPGAAFCAKCGAKLQ